MAMAIVIAILIGSVALTGCAAPYQRDDVTVQLVRSGEYGRARERVDIRAAKADDRNFVLNRMKLLTLSVDDGVTDATEVNADQVYDLLRTQGLNDDKTVSTFLFGEGGTRIYKGEPYEQALAYSYIALFDGLQGEWGNVRASAGDSLFLLREFTGGSVGSGGGRQRRRDNAQASIRGADADLPETLAYTPIASDFELGLILKAIAAAHLGEREEATDAVTRLETVAPRLAGLGQAILGGNYNTVLVAAYGTAPRKVGSGPDNVIAAYLPTTPSDDASLLVRVGAAQQRVAIATDVNRLARDVRWRNLEDLRVAKSSIGQALTVGGAAVAIGAKDDEAKLAGAGVALAGLLLRATSGVDERHNEVFPQRFYVALLDVPGGESAAQGAGRLEWAGSVAVEVEIEGKPSSRVVLRGLQTPGNAGTLSPSQANLPSTLQLAFVRMPVDGTGWAGTGNVLYNNDATPAVAGDTLPYILGGRCVRTPSADAMESYYRAGLARSVTLNELIDLYREEGVQVLGESTQGSAGRHILEGGRWLFTPSTGSAGFARLYGREASLWVLRSELGAEIRARMGPQNSVAPKAQPKAGTAVEREAAQERPKRKRRDGIGAYLGL